MSHIFEKPICNLVLAPKLTVKFQDHSGLGFFFGVGFLTVLFPYVFG